MKHLIALSALLVAGSAIAGDDMEQMPVKKQPQLPKYEQKMGKKMAQEKAGLKSSWLKVEGSANLDYFAKDSNDFETNLRLKDAQVKLTAKVANGVKAVLVAELTRMLIENGVETDGDVFDIEKFVKEAYIEIRMHEITGTPVAVIIGKHKVAFGQQASRLPMYKDNLLYEAGRIDEVLGLTVKLDKFLLGTVLEASVFENSVGDLDIGNAAGASIRLSKQLSEKLKATASAAAIAANDDYEWDDMQKRAALGFVYDNGNGTWKAYTEGFYIEGSSKYPNSNYGATAGVAVVAGPGEVVVEYSYLENVAHEVALAYNLPINQNLIISPEVRHSFNEVGSDDTRIGARARVQFNTDSGKRN